MKIVIEHDMTKDEAKEWIDARMPSLMLVMAKAITEAHAEFMALPRWRRWLLYAWAVPRHGPGYLWDKGRRWLRDRRRILRS